MSPDIQWLQPGELQADALLDLRTMGNELSLWDVSDLSVEQRVAVALAANRNNLDHLDYAVLDVGEPRPLRSSMREETGNTPDSVANALHVNLYNVTVEVVSRLASMIAVSAQKRILRKDLKGFLLAGLQSGTLLRERMKPGLLSDLGLMG